MQMVVSVNFRFLGRRKNSKVEITLTPMHSRSRRGRNRSMFFVVQLSSHDMSIRTTQCSVWSVYAISLDKDAWRPTPTRLHLRRFLYKQLPFFCNSSSPESCLFFLSELTLCVFFSARETISI